LFPAEDWLWLLQRRRELAVQPVQTAPPSARKAPGLSIPFAAWEPADRRRWQRGLTPQATGTHLERATRRRHELTDGGPLSVALPTERRRPTHQWSTATIRSARYAYGAFLKFVRERDGADCAVTPQAVAAWVETMLGRMTPLSLGNRVRDLHAAMRILDPDGDWRWLRSDADILLRDARPIREKTTRMASIPDIRRAAIRRMRRAEQAPALITSALMFQDGFIMLLLSYRPVRRRNLAATRLGPTSSSTPPLHSAGCATRTPRWATATTSPCPFGSCPGRASLSPCSGLSSSART